MDEDMILPDDYVEETAQPEAEETLEAETVEPESETTLTEQQQEQQTELPKIKVKYNHEEQELGYDEAVPLIQKGMNYDKLQERLNAFENDPRLAYVEKQAARHNMTTTEYLQAIEAQEEQDRLNELIANNIPEDIAKEILESRKDREERQKEKKAQEEQANKDRQLNDFLTYFRDENGRSFDRDKDTIPKEVEEAYNAGTPLKFAYMQYQNKQLRTQLKVAKKNEENIKRAPLGSVSAHGSTEVAAEDDFMKGFNSV